ncbi:MAG TPA: TPM domain-containing protein, partial [Caulobacteraceae bacterium]|nr:TPM domain-containing protein [Caulobacteraceae bacterium]
MLLSEADHEKIRLAVDAAEARTSGEIVSVLAKECSEYWEVPLVWAAAVALIAPLAGVLLGLEPRIAWWLGGGWMAANAGGAQAQVGSALIAYAVIQAALFVVVALIVSIPPVRRLLTPRALKRERVHRRALEQFMTRAYHLTEHDTGVLIFASLAERQAIVLADDGIADKVSGKEWKGVVDALVAGMKAGDAGHGFVSAIGKAADLLASHCPRRPDDHTQLPDTVIELDF